MRSTLIVGTFACLWITGFFGERVEEHLALALIFSFGLLHGANDIQILRQMRPKGRERVWNSRILFLYVFFVLGVGLLFVWLPGLALGSFVGFSAYHFGEQHWVSRLSGANRVPARLVFTAYGSGILCLLFAFHPDAVLRIVRDISGYTLGELPFGLFALFLLAVSVLGAVLLLPRGESQRQIPFELFLLGVFAVVFSRASLLWSFAIYFVLWHAIPSLADQIRLLYGQVNRVNGLKYLKSSVLYWGASVVTLLVVLVFSRHADYGFLPVFFSFLAAITFPHVLTMSGFLKR